MKVAAATSERLATSWPGGGGLPVALAPPVDRIVTVFRIISIGFSGTR